MPDDSSTTPETPAEGNLRSRGRVGPIDPDAKRFDFFLIDTRWNTPVSHAVHAHMKVLREFQSKDHFYELTREQSVEVLKHDPALIGRDPTLIVYDQFGSDQEDGSRYQGFRLNLGMMKNAEQAMARLQEFIRFLATHRSAERLDREIRRELHREGMKGMVKLLRETTVELLVE